jgi:hypothetical protein
VRAVLAFVLGAAPLLAQTTERVSVDSSGAEANGDDYAWGGGISADGRWVVFGGYASNLVANDTNALRDVFVRDRETGTTERVSVDSAGGEANDFSWNCEFAIAADGRCVAFVSYASNLVPGDTNKDEDVFVHDRSTGVTERVSVDSSGAEANGEIAIRQLAALHLGDGRVVAFTSFANNSSPATRTGCPTSSSTTGAAGVPNARASIVGRRSERRERRAVRSPRMALPWRSRAARATSSPVTRTRPTTYLIHDRTTGTTER